MLYICNQCHKVGTDDEFESVQTFKSNDRDMPDEWELTCCGDPENVSEAQKCKECGENCVPEELTHGICENCTASQIIDPNQYAYDRIANDNNIHPAFAGLFRRN